MSIFETQKIHINAFSQVEDVKLLLGKMETNHSQRFSSQLTMTPKRRPFAKRHLKKLTIQPMTF